MNEQAQALLDKATENLNAARHLILGHHFEIAASRAYYAMFYAAEALLLDEGLEFSSHGAVHGAFGERMAKTGRLDPKFHRYLLDAYRARQSADYDAPADIDEQDAQALADRAQEFVLAVKRVLRADQ